MGIMIGEFGFFLAPQWAFVCKLEGLGGEFGGDAEAGRNLGRIGLGKVGVKPGVGVH